MLAEAEDLRAAFQESLNCAIAHSLRPSRWVGLGDETCTAIEAVAREHPEATVDHIADAYDAFAREHGAADNPMVGEEPLPFEPPKRLVARRGRFWHR
jgi:hypothetical protein